MPTYLYCFLPIPRESPARDEVSPPSGIGGAAVRMLRISDVMAWVSDTVATSSPIVERSEHAHVVLAALATGETPLPARVGQHFADDDTLRVDVVARMSMVMTSLERIRGRVEMILHLHVGAPAAAIEGTAADGVGTPASGRGYLVRRRGELERAKAAQATGERLRSVIRHLLPDIVERDAVLAVGETHRYIVSHLIRREDVVAWHTRASSLILEGVERVILAGPFPPYDFVASDGPDGPDRSAPDAAGS